MLHSQFKSCPANVSTIPANSTCCDRGGPWFTTTLSEEVSDDIEVRMCSYNSLPSENLGVDAGANIIILVIMKMLEDALTGDNFVLENEISNCAIITIPNLDGELVGFLPTVTLTLTGRARGYQYHASPTFYNYHHGDQTILDSTYVSGLSVTYGSPHSPIWMFAAGLTKDFNCTISSSVPSRALLWLMQVMNEVAILCTVPSTEAAIPH